MVHFEVHGRTDADAEILVLSSGLGGSGSYWAPQIAALADHFRVITYDHHGTGRTGGEVPADGGIAAMADDVIQLIEHLNVRRVHFVGHALGGLIGLWLAHAAPAHFRRLVLVNAWSKVDPHSLRCFAIRLELLEKSGIPAFVQAQPLFLYPAVWMSENAARLDADEAHGIAHFQGETNLRRRIAALGSFDIDAHLAQIACPTLVMATRDDLLVPYTRSTRLFEGLPNAELRVFEHGGHAMNITEPATFNTELLDYLTRA